jgi:hypothetical protein
MTHELVKIDSLTNFFISTKALDSRNHEVNIKKDDIAHPAGFRAVIKKSKQGSLNVKSTYALSQSGSVLHSLAGGEP